MGEESVGLEQLGGAIQPTGVSVDTPRTPTQTPSPENSASPATTSATPSETELASQGLQQAQPVEPQKANPDQSANPAKEQSSNQTINMIQVLKQEFNLEEAKLEKLQELAKAKDIDLNQYSENDLGNAQTMTKILSLLEKVELTPEQRKKLDEIKTTLGPAIEGQQLTKEEIYGKIGERREELNKKMQEIEGSGELTDEEKKEKLEEIQKALDSLGEMKSDMNQLDNLSTEEKAQKRKDLYKKASGYFQTIGFGLTGLFLLYAWKSLSDKGEGAGASS
jgi:hypothetical protein